LLPDEHDEPPGGGDGEQVEQDGLERQDQRAEGTDASRPALGTIVPNPGGPGSGAIDEAADWRELLAPLRRRRDILLIDPRGTGRSGALSCPGLAAKDPLSLDLAGLVTTCAPVSVRARRALRLVRRRRRLRCRSRRAGY